MPVGGEVIAAVPFVGRARDVLLGFKYRNRRQLAHHLAGLLVNKLLAEGVHPHTIDVVTWAPTSRRHRQQRGFDQAEVVARRVAAQMGLPCRRLLERDPSSVAQTGLDRASRLHGPSFRASPRAAGEAILLIDDVVTTGSTLRSADHALRAAGAQAVTRSAVATTPALVHRATTRTSTAVRARRRPTNRGVVIQGPWAA